MYVFNNGFESGVRLIADQSVFTNRHAGVFYPADVFIIMSVTFETDTCPQAVEYLIKQFLYVFYRFGRNSTNILKQTNK